MARTLGDSADPKPDLPETGLSKSETITTDLQPLPYHVAIRDYLQTEESALWKWFSKTKTQDDHAEAIRFDLLKTTYRIDSDSDPELYVQAARVSKRLNLDVPITLYQAQNPGALNASICTMTNEAHIVFQGPITERLEASELDALIAHELGHLMLWRNWDKQFLTTELILDALTKDPRAQPAHFETARLFRLHTEIFCDRACLDVIDDPHLAISMLVKITTDVKNANASSYLKQAKEIAAKGELSSDGVTHPEAFIRALATESWADADSPKTQDAANKQISQMISGKLDINTDLLGQQQLSKLTRQLIDWMLASQWMQTDLTVAHAKAYFNDYQPPLASKSKLAPTDTDSAKASKSIAAKLLDQLKNATENLKKYVAYVILDFVAADRDLEHAPIALALNVCEQIGIKTLFCDIARKELRLRKKQMDLISETRGELIAAAAQAKPSNTK